MKIWIIIAACLLLFPIGDKITRSIYRGGRPDPSSTMPRGNRGREARRRQRELERRLAKEERELKKESHNGDSSTN